MGGFQLRRSQYRRLETRRHRGFDKILLAKRWDRALIIFFPSRRLEPKQQRSLSQLLAVGIGVPLRLRRQGQMVVWLMQPRNRWQLIRSDR